MASKRKARFKVGQVVRHRVDGGFYARVLDKRGLIDGKPGEIPVMEQGEIKTYRAEQLRPLTAREKGGK